MADTPVQAAPSLPRRHPLRRIGCLFGLLLWALLMIAPCSLFLLATQGQFTLALGSAPGQEARLWLINEARVRGLALAWPSVHQADEHSLCVQTDTYFLLWAGSGEPATFCECYTRTSTEAGWTPTDAYSRSCQP